MKTQKGFHYLLLIIIILSVALVGLVGFTFWKSSQTDSNKQQDNNSNNNSGKNDEPAPQVTSVKFTANSGLGYNFSVSYPSNWTKAENFTQSDTNTGAPRDLISFTSPSGKIIVKYSIGYLGGLGGMCDEQSNEITKMGTMHSYFTSKINSLSAAYLIEYVYKNNTNVTEVDTYISTKETFEIGGNACQQFLTEIVALNPKTELNEGSSWSGIWNSQIILGDIQNSDGTIKDGVTTANVETARANTEYIDAKNILLSSSYSKI